MNYKTTERLEITYSCEALNNHKCILVKEAGNINCMIPAVWHSGNGKAMLSVK